MAPKAPEVLTRATKRVKGVLRTAYENGLIAAPDSGDTVSDALRVENVKAEVFGAPIYLQPEAFEGEFVGFYESRIADGKTDADILAELYDAIEAYMELHGVQTDKGKADFDKDEYENVLVALFAAAESTTEQWRKKDPMTDKPRRDAHLAKMRDKYSQPIWDKWEEEQANESLDDVKKESSDLAKKYGELLRKRADKAGIFERTKKLESAQEAHEELVSALATQMMVENDATRALSEEDLNTAIAAFIDEQTNLFIDRMEQSRVEKIGDRNRVMGFVMRKWSAWTPVDPSAQASHRLLSMQTLKSAGRRFQFIYSKENYKGTLAKNAITALGGAALGFGVAFVMPVAAAAGVVGAAAGFVGTRAARAYAIQKMNSAADERIATLQRKDIEARITTLRGEYDTTHETFKNELGRIDTAIEAAQNSGDTDAVTALQTEKDELVANADTRSLHEMIADLTAERAKAAHDFNRNRLLGGMAAGMFFGGVGALVHDFVPSVPSMNIRVPALVPDSVKEGVGDFIATNPVAGPIKWVFDHFNQGENTAAGQSSDGSVTPDETAHPNEGRLPTSDLRGEGYAKAGTLTNGGNTAPTPAPGDTGGNGVNPVEKAPAAPFDAKAFLDEKDVDLALKKGEGFYSLAKHFPGVSQAEMKAEMVSLAKELDAKYPKLVYFTNGEPRLSMPADGKLPEGAAKIIVEHFQSKGMLDTEATMAATEVKGSDAIGIRKGGGIISEAKDYGIKDLTGDEVKALGDALVTEGTGYKSDSLADRFGSPYGIKLDVVGDDTPSGQFRPGADAIFRDFADDRTLNNSVKLGAADTATGSTAAQSSNTTTGPNVVVAPAATSEQMRIVTDGIRAPYYESLNPATAGIMDTLNQLVSEGSLHLGGLTVGDYDSLINRGDVSRFVSEHVPVPNLIASDLSEYAYSDGKPIIQYNPIRQQYEFNSPSGNDSVLPDKVRTIVQRGLTAMANQLRTAA
ncbi:MAG: hypothetical protein WAT17_02475 [Candidatus Saccharimonadales bacterium]